MKRLYNALLLVSCLLAAMVPQVAMAQDDGILIEPYIPPDYDRGRNVSVLDRPRPDYDPLGIHAGGFMVYPSIDVGIGYNDNIFLSETDATGGAYAVVAPAIKADSDWSRHKLSASARGNFHRYFDHSVRNEDNWNAGLLGRLDVTGNASVLAEGQVGRTVESPFSGAIDAGITSLSSYDYSLASLRGEYLLGRNRFALAYNRNEFSFNDIEFANLPSLDQSNRDRTIDGVVGQAERALSPITSVYAQVSYSHTDYDQLLASGTPNRDSDGYRLIAGISMDLPAFLRGTVAAGYTWRNYDAPIFHDVRGLSVDAKLEYFPSELTTFTLRARRVIQDSSIGTTSAYFDNRASLTIDHELLRNLIVSASGDVAVQNYVDSPRESTIYRLGARARYFMTRQLSARLQATYSARDRDRETAFGDGTLSEFRLEASISFKL